MLFIKNRVIRLIIYGIFLINILTVYTLFRNRKRFLNLMMSIYRAFISTSQVAGWKSGHINHIFPEIKDITDLKVNQNINDIEAEIPPDPRWIYYLALITKSTKPRNIFEIGTFRGRATLCMAMNSPQKTKIYTLDLPPEIMHSPQKIHKPDAITIKVLRAENSLGGYFKRTSYSKKITQLLGDSMTFDYTPYYKKMDIVLIDGAHDYQHVLSDTGNALRMVKKGGIIIFDDFGHLNYNYDVIVALKDLGLLSKGFQLEDTALFVIRN